jgi:hypothetical protein
VHGVQFRDTVADPGKGIPFLFAFRMEPGLTDPDGSKLREMIAFGDTLKREGKFVETAPLAKEPPPGARRGARRENPGDRWAVRRVEGNPRRVQPRPRREPRRGDRDREAHPHARWGPVEVRELLFLDPA